MLRISVTSTAPPAATLRLEGQIAGAWTAELERAGRGVALVHCSPFQEEQLRLAGTPRRDMTPSLP